MKIESDSQCVCFQRLPEGSKFQEIGEDTTDGRYGDVSVSTCAKCGSRWLNYFAEYEGFTGSQRWIRGILPEEIVIPFSPEEAIPILNTLPWYFFRMSGQTVQCARGDAPADLTSMGGEHVELTGIET